MKRIAMVSLLVAITGMAGTAWHARDMDHVTRTAPSPEKRREQAGRDAPGDSPFWEWRLSYPTGQYSARWYLDAQDRHNAIEKSAPRNHPEGKLTEGVLATDRVTALGPSPLRNNSYGLVGGRVTALVTHPSQPNVAWF